MTVPREEANGVKCADCAHAKKQTKYHPIHLVCINPLVLATTGGPRSCRDVARTSVGLCKPEGHLFLAKTVVLVT